MTSNVPAPSVSRLPLVITAVVVALLLLVTIALIAARGSATFDEGTPEAALQRYLIAAFDGDEEAMLDRLTVAGRDQCRLEMQDSYRWNDWPGDDLQADLQSMEEGADGQLIATVRFARSSSDDPFGSSWNFEDTFILVADDDGWLIDQAGWPHQFESCTVWSR